MAYAVYEDLQLKNPKSVQYYPEEYDYYNKISDLKSSYTPIQNAKKSKKSTPSVNYANERKCPIYVHQYNKIPSFSTYNNYSSKTLSKIPTEKPFSSKTKKIHTSHGSKSVLDQLEETYWATWKPNKENRVRKGRNIEEKGIKNKAHGDSSETLVKYFVRGEFNTSADSFMDDIHSEKFKRKFDLINVHNIDDFEKHSPKPATTNTQQIQTEGYPLILPKIEENIESGTNIENNSINESNATIKVYRSEDEAPKFYDEAELERSDIEEDSIVLKHTDSFIINKKKQSETKDHFQQPKCIKLYKKPGATSSFLRGGSYPLKSCLKREPVQKGNFKLGAPGSPILVTNSSYSRKSRK